MNSFKIALFLTSLGLLNSSFAVPTIYPKNPTRLSEIKNPTNSNIIAESDDDHVFWVMPPNSGTSEVLGLHTITANVGFCREMGDLQSYSRETSRRLNDLVALEADSKYKLDNKVNQLARAREDLANYVAISRLEDLDSIDNRVGIIESQLTTLREELSACTQYCRTLGDQIVDLRNEKRDLTIQRREIVISQAQTVRAYEKKKAARDAIIAELQDIEDSWENIRARLQKLHGTFLDIYSSFAKMEGSRAAIVFDNKWDLNVEELKNANPGYAFQKIQTQNAVITTSVAQLASIPTSGAIMSYDMGGTYSEGKLTLPSYPENTTGNVRLSLLGTCPVLHPEYFDINLPNGSDQMKYGMTVSYEYPTSFIAKATASYTMSKVYQKIMKSGTKGGFFKSKSWSSVEERTFFKDAFDVVWEEQDESNSFTDDEKAEIEREMRNQIFGRLAAIGLPHVANPGILIAPTLPVNGGTVLGTSLENNKACSKNVYCQAAAIGIKTLTAIFGSSSTTASYLNTQTALQHETYSREKVVMKPWISSYR